MDLRRGFSFEMASQFWFNLVGLSSNKLAEIE